ncbi:hypothetical protein WJX81_006920 [Elliptochloris bilobata]|uniref:Response regulatory domain-containing protein n=1 Tax=Elliptochloris bilobata TaxID=381761 RepID=A0AAW1R196_9CHLO
MGSARAASSPKAKRILVVDDQRLNRLFLGKLLSSLGYEIVYGTNGHEAVHIVQTSMAAERGEQDSLFCILMDINMPELDGLQANVDTSTERPWKACGMDCWLDKPVNQRTLRAALERLEAGASLLHDLPTCSAGRDLPGATAGENGLSQPARCSVRPLGGDDTDVAAMRARPALEQVSHRGLGARYARAAKRIPHVPLTSNPKYLAAEAAAVRGPEVRMQAQRADA